ncbi:PSD1 and planctomycete cytochrome C domain-containing protein [Verrucomicrobiales bacterium BCK34]|nr:PSD1 and planctomycete cytochrome C domain-containing protein [Verrucomicrobiales bacterium BCK34]
MKSQRAVFFVFLILWATDFNAALASSGTDFFEAKIRPVLIENCYKCHSVESGKSKGGLLLDTRAGTHLGGDNGPAVVPGNVEESLLIAAISHAQPDLEMPPKKERLPDGVIADFRKWIESGAPDPRTESTGSISAAPTDLESGRKFWAFKKPQQHPVPESLENTDWPKSDTDQFIIAKLEENGLTPSSDAAPEILVRRLHFDLTGLPPSLEEQRGFLKSVAEGGIDKALAERTDQLLASERFGERWGRHWLDVARFAESSGKESNFTFPEAWRYRDYVIDAFNNDIPFDRFITEQLAGDLLPAKDDAERARLLIATGYLAIGPLSLNAMSREQSLADVADEQINASTQAFMGTTVACARCHDHKFDPISMEDYYAMVGIFRSSKTYYGTAVGPDNQLGGDLIHLPKSLDLPVFYKALKPEDVAKLKQEKIDLIAKEEEAKAKAARAAKEGKDPSEFFSLQMAIGGLWRKGAIDGQLALVDEDGNPNAMCMGVTEAEEIGDSPVYERGELATPRDSKVPRGFPEVVQLSDPPEIPDDESGRLQYAEWLTHPDHPLTARVLANRVWNHLFRTGIVRTTDNFGFNGERPSHPELLDHLAMQLVNEHEWSVKGLIRELVLSRSYRQSSDFRESAFLKDPENRFLWRMSKRRLDAEEIRDAMLFVAGDIELTRPVASLIGRTGGRNAALLPFAKNIPADLDGSVHRSVYLPIVRDRLPDVLELFDFAESSLVTGHRETTNVPMQALYFMNSDFVEKRSASFAKRVMSDAGEEPEKHIERAFKLCFNRPPSEEESALANEFFRSTTGEDSLKRYCQALLSTATFRNLD